MRQWNSSPRLRLELCFVLFGIFVLVSCSGTAQHKDTKDEVTPAQSEVVTTLIGAIGPTAPKTSTPSTNSPETSTNQSNLSQGSPKLTANFPAPPLTQEAALLRSRQIGRITYSLWFALGTQSPDFLGRTTIRFELKPKAQDHSKIIPIDFEGGTLRTVSLNGTPLTDLSDPERYDGHHIFL
ncbi:MAG: hypothetical protein ABI041_13245, partial [Bdellovibrionia bacterium]